MVWIIYPLYQSLKAMIKDQDIESILTPEFSEYYIDMEFCSVIMLFDPLQAIQKLNEISKSVSITRGNTIKKIIRNAEFLMSNRQTFIPEELNRNKMYEQKSALPTSLNLY